MLIVMNLYKKHVAFSLAVGKAENILFRLFVVKLGEFTYV